MKKPSSSPPDLRGFEYVRWLGGGGFADVFLFRQRRPNRDVAIKVLRQSVFDATIQSQFEAEADLMAAVSEHPYIVSIYSADIAPDGRPYLAMEYYPKGHYLDRARQGGVTVDEALRVGIQIASAVETAHEAGIFHNDIKPSNVLMSGFDRPGLTDFGISVVDTDDSGTGARGASLPYTAPEIIEDELSGSRTADVFALGATIYALLNGHSPFERQNASNAPADVLDRVLHTDPPPLRRNGVPPSLENLLRQALSRQAVQRPQSARAFAVSLQSIEQELGFQMTSLELRTAAAPNQVAPDPSDLDNTRYRAPVVVRPDDPASFTPGVRAVAPIDAGPMPVAADATHFAPMPIATESTGRGLDDPVPVFVPSEAGGARSTPTDHTQMRNEWVPPADATARRDAAPLPVAEEATDSRGPGERRLKIAAGVVVLALALGAAVALLVGDPPPPQPPPQSTTITLTPPLVAPTDLSVRFVGEGVVEATWTPPVGEPVTDYEVKRTDASAKNVTAVVVDPKITIDGLKADEVPCIEVSSRRANRISQSATPTTCATR